MVSPQCPLDIPVLSSYHGHAVLKGCSCSIPILLLWCHLIFPGCPVPIGVHMLCLQYCHRATSVLPYCPRGVPMPCPQYSQIIPRLSVYCINAVPPPLWCPPAVPLIFPFCLHSVPMGCPLHIPILSSYCSHAITLLFLWDDPLGVPSISPCYSHTVPLVSPCPYPVPSLQGPPFWWAPSAGPSWSPSSRATSTPRLPKGRR